MSDIKRARIEYDKIIQKRAENYKEVLELKEKAKEYGYYLSSLDIDSYTRYLPCVCGYDKIKSKIYDSTIRNRIVKCPVCNLFVIAEHQDAQEAWNDMIESKTKVEHSGDNFKCYYDSGQRIN